MTEESQIDKWNRGLTLFEESVLMDGGIDGIEKVCPKCGLISDTAYISNAPRKDLYNFLKPFQDKS